MIRGTVSRRPLLFLDIDGPRAWMGDANQWIGPVLGLPPLPFVDFGDHLMRERPDGVHWKSEPVVAYADGRPFAWVDDEQTDADHAHISTIHPAPALLHHVNPRHASACGRTTSPP